jgi:hypothetical protein
MRAQRQTSSRHQPSSRRPEPVVAAASEQHQPNAAATTPTQGELFCVVCLGHLVIAAEVWDRHGEPVTVPAPCPLCRPRPGATETWLAAVRLARRLATGTQR